MSPLWFWILGWLLNAATAVGNGSVIFLIITRRRLHTTANCFILSLAVADFCVGVTLVPFKFICEFWPTGYCTALRHVRWFFIYASVSNLCAMAAERYIAIVKPLRYNTLMQRSRLVLLVSVAWGAPTLIRLVGFSVAYSFDKRAALSYFLPVILILFEFLPCPILVIVTTRMVLIARKISRRTAALVFQLRFNHATATRRVRANAENSTVRVIGFVVAFFVFCFAASLFTAFCDIDSQHCSTPTYIRYLRRLCLVANSAANPIAYAFMKKDIRRELKRTFKISSDRAEVIGSIKLSTELGVLSNVTAVLTR